MSALATPTDTYERANEFRRALKAENCDSDRQRRRRAEYARDEMKRVLDTVKSADLPLRETALMRIDAHQIRLLATRIINQ